MLKCPNLDSNWSNVWSEIDYYDTIFKVNMVFTWKEPNRFVFYTMKSSGDDQSKPSHTLTPSLTHQLGTDPAISHDWIEPHKIYTYKTFNF